MNDDTVDSWTALVPAAPRHPEPGPGEDLTAKQREACRLGLLDDLTVAQVAERVGVSYRTIERWRAKPAFKRYTQYLVSTLVQEETQKARAILAKAVPEAARRLAYAATTKRGKLAHPYAVDAARTLFDRVAGKPQAAPTVEAGVEVPTEHGPIRIIFKAGE